MCTTWIIIGQNFGVGGLISFLHFCSQVLHKIKPISHVQGHHRQHISVDLCIKLNARFGLKLCKAYGTKTCLA